jgi:hypothetical protein
MGWSAIRRQLRHRPRVASIFPNPDSCLAWSALCLPNSTTNQTHKVYLNLNP